MDGHAGCELVSTSVDALMFLTFQKGGLLFVPLGGGDIIQQLDLFLKLQRVVWCTFFMSLGGLCLTGGIGNNNVDPSPTRLCIKHVE